MRSLCIILFFLCFCSGCSTRIPEPITYPYSQQYKMQASQHWLVLAADLANRINNQLIVSDNIDKTVFVQETCGDESIPCEPLETSTFNEAFRDMLITNLVDYGVPTSNKASEEVINIQYKVQVVRHNTERLRTLQPGVLTALSAAVVVLRNAPSELAIVAAGVAADMANANMAISGRYEVIITTSMVDRDKYLFRASDIYYINDRDFWQYSTTKPKSATLTLGRPATGRINSQKLPLTTPPETDKAEEPEAGAMDDAPMQTNKKTNL